MCGERVAGSGVCSVAQSARGRAIAMHQLQNVSNTIFACIQSGFDTPECVCFLRAVACACGDRLRPRTRENTVIQLTDARCIRRHKPATVSPGLHLERITDARTIYHARHAGRCCLVSVAARAEAAQPAPDGSHLEAGGSAGRRSSFHAGSVVHFRVGWLARQPVQHLGACREGHAARDSGAEARRRRHPRQSKGHQHVQAGKSAPADANASA